MKPFNELQTFKNGGMDTDDAFEYIQAPDYSTGYNIRNTGSHSNEAGNITNPESTTLVTTDYPAGILKGLGGGSFEETRQLVYFRYSSAGFHQIISYSADTGAETILFTDITDSDDIPILTLNPRYYVVCVLINSTYLLWTDGINGVGYTNLKTLTSGDYGTVLAEDLSLIKPQNLIPISAAYADDAGRAANFVKSKLFQFTSQWVNADYNYSTWGTWSKRIIPLQESTPIVGTDVSVNNCIIVGVDIGSIRATQLNVACRYGQFDFNIIKTVDRGYVIALPDTSVDIGSAIYEAYDPSTNIYSFVFYNESLNIPVPPTETDQFVDAIPKAATALTVLNGNIAALGDLTIGYPRPQTDVTVKAVGYDPNLTVPQETITDPLIITYTNPGSSGSGLGDHKRYVQVNYLGTPRTNDILTIILSDIRDAASRLVYTYTVPGADAGNLFDTVGHFAQTIPNASYRLDTASPQMTLSIITPSYYGLQSATINLYNSGATVSKSIHTILDNSSYQLALSYRDKWGRPFPLETNNQFIINSPSFAQLNGQAVRVSATINTANAPAGAVDYQWLITKNLTVINMLDVLGNLINYIGGWDAASNTPTLQANTGTVGDTYQITTPSGSATPVNLGNGEQEFKTGDFVVYNGKSWDIVAKSFADLSSTSNVLGIKINPLNLFNQLYADEQLQTVLNYDFTANDRCTLHYYIDPATPTIKNYLNSPCIDIDVYGYDPATFILKVQKSASISTGTLSGKNIYLRVYTPNTQQSTSTVTTDNTTVWYEIGERYTITDGVHDALQVNITDGDVYFKTRSYAGAVDPSVSYPGLATDFNFSDFYVSNFNSYGRPRTYYDTLEETEQKATIIFSQNYVLGSKRNGLNRFYAENAYGESDGQTSSSYGAIRALWQRGDMLEVFQELRVGSIPVYRSIIEDQLQQQQLVISEKLLNNIRYSQTANVGMGMTKIFCFKDNDAFFVDPNRSEPFRYGLDGLQSISGKMSKFFKATLQAAFAQGKQIVLYYNKFYDEVMLCIEDDGGIVTYFPFSSDNWRVDDGYTLTPADILTVGNGAHCTAAWNTVTGQVVYTPTSGYVGNDTSVISINTPSGTRSKNICLNWTAGDDTVNDFSFNPLFDQPLSTVVYSNVISVLGINIAVPISITGGEYRINSGAWTSSAGTVVNNDTVQVRQTTSASLSTTTTATLTISASSGAFMATTISANAFRLNTAYGYTITSVVDGTATGTPASFASLSIPANGSVSDAYTTITAGTVSVTITGTAVFPNQQLDLTIGGVLIQRVPIPTAGTYALTFPLTNDPTQIIIGIDQY